MATKPDRRGGGALRSALVGLVASASVAACGSPDVPASPTWVDVQPIVRAQCTSCHGASAEVTGGGYRFDFYDMNQELCGDAAKALDPNQLLAHDLALTIWGAVTTTVDRPTTRPRMPPEPAPYLDDWEWQTIKGWYPRADKGKMPQGNTPPRIQIFGDFTVADQSLDVTAVVEDVDGDPVAGVLTFGDFTLRMDRGGAFSAHIDTSAWATGPRTIGTVLCDGWSSVRYILGSVYITHAF